MKVLHLHRDEDGLGSYPQDVYRIVRAMIGAGFFVTPIDAYEAWLRFSDAMCAGWMMLPDSDDEIVATIRGYFDGED